MLQKFLLFILLGLSNPLMASLINNGNGYIYDTDLNVTWYDANPGLKTWDEAKGWVSGLGAGWRLPTISGSTCADSTANGASDCGFNVDPNSSELAHLFFAELNNKSYYDINGVVQSGFGLINTGLFSNLQNGEYWFGSLNSSGGSNSFATAWVFCFNDGRQNNLADVRTPYNVLAVHAGNISAVPVPATIWLLGAGLIGLIRYRKNS